MDKMDKIVGCIVGGAIGDCMGGPYEGQQMPLKLDRGHRWKLSDDTQITLATCEAISRRGYLDDASIAGQIVGTLIGRRGLPKEMVDCVPDLNFIENTAARFSETVLREAA